MVLWIFGYGSLVWQAGFDYDERVIGFIKGYERVFHQGSTDHRGTRERPGRAVTIEPQEGTVCWGVAYRVSGQDAEQLVLSYLDIREKQYDIKAYVDLYTDDASALPTICGVLVYIASPDKIKNRNYLGPAPLDQMANQIAKAIGPSGPNYEYLFRLEEALQDIGHADEGIIKLANEVRKLLAESNGSI
ncbi:hypothetical protein O6H91_06G030300 [Diphasiastrum complanatum]|uniref:Uncharacterized protein n=2 Tax=Diphasiastrum complanatum TaxID=34168 RepID=A0ACC2DC08_DIPCM|nr:hypothetical protein O6H91_06G030300 [Diphasiastrum complanatum]KAJ7551821.1 hypothetical protein O6H91_06G030300 [Diphasiastrum complanatum]